MADFEDVGQLVQDWPEVAESTSYGTPAIKVKGKLMARLREDGETLAIRATFQNREGLPQVEAQTFSVPPHYANAEMLVVNLPTVSLEQLRELLADAWELTAPKSVLKSHSKP